MAGPRWCVLLRDVDEARGVATSDYRHVHKLFSMFDQAPIFVLHRQVPLFPSLNSRWYVDWSVLGSSSC